MKSIINFFSRISGVYEKEIHEKSLGTMYLSSIEKNFITESINRYASKNKRCLEIGAGSGRITELLVKNGYTVNIIENAPGMVKILNRKFKKDKVNTKLADAGKKFPFPAHSFNLVVTIRVLKYIKEWKNTLQEVNRVLDNKGYFIFSISNIYSVAYFKGNACYFLFKPKEVMDYLNKSGFEILKISTTSRLPFPIYSILNSSLLLVIIIGIEKILDIILPYWLFSRSILICARKR